MRPVNDKTPTTREAEGVLSSDPEEGTLAMMRRALSITR
jgi:hypothetical protein